MPSPLSAVEAPLVIQDPDQLSWDDVSDVVVVGFGGAGAATALQALELGAQVTAVDRFEGGGATAYSAGVVYAGNTSYQRQAGIADSSEDMFNYLRREIGSAVKESTLQRFCQSSADDLDWLARHGVPFRGDAYLGKCALPPDGKYLYYSGNENRAGYREWVKPAPRGHRTVGSGWTGHVYYKALASAAISTGVRLETHTRALRLVVTEQGAVVGVEVSALPNEGECRARHMKLYKRVSPTKPFNNRAAESAIVRCRKLEEVGARKRLRAKGGVVIATGGFIYNLPLLRRGAPHIAEHAMGLIRMGSMGCDGSGIELGVSAGAATGFMAEPTIQRVLAPPSALLDGIVVNARGERFTNEEGYAGFLGRDISRQPNGKAWLIVDRATFRRSLLQILRAGATERLYCLSILLNMLLGGTKRARTVEALALKCGMDANALQRTIAVYNGALKQGIADPLGKTEGFNRPIEIAPYRAINVSLGNPFAFTIAMTLGGLMVDESSGHVLRADGTRIIGLYAAGRAAVGVCSETYLSGLSIADTVFSARRAARSACGQCSVA